MTKRVEKQLGYFKYSGEPVRFRLGTLLVMILAVQLLVVSAFTEINFKHLIFPLDIFSNWSFYFPDGDVNASGFVRHIQYIPQVPMLFFLLGLLDKKYSLITVALYIIAGFIGYPIFSMGGGWKYIFQYGVGYILAYIPTIWVSGTILDRNFDFKNIVKSVLFGLVIINLIGGVVLLFIATLRHESWIIIKNLLYSLTGFKFVYDLIFSVIAVYLGLFVKRFLWIILS